MIVWKEKSGDTIAERFRDRPRFRVTYPITAYIQNIDIASTLFFEPEIVGWTIDIEKVDTSFQE